MALDPATEPPIDTASAHHMEERALAVALDKARTAQERAKVEHLLGLRAALMRQREAFMKEATAMRHARGEIYSASRVAAINAMGASRERMEQEVRTLYLGQPGTRGVLEAHARVHFTTGLVSARLLLSAHTPDIAAAARDMHAREEAFAAEWIAAIGDAAFEAQLRQSQREALAMLRTSARPMVMVTEPGWDSFGDDDAQDLGKAWNKLDELAQALGLEPLSSRIALPGETDAGVAAARLAPVIDALAQAVQSPARKFPAKRATLAVLEKMRERLRAMPQDGRAWFEVDL